MLFLSCPVEVSMGFIRWCLEFGLLMIAMLYGGAALVALLPATLVMPVVALVKKDEVLMRRTLEIQLGMWRYACAALAAGISFTLLT